jgi:hypothetical protein
MDRQADFHYISILAQVKSFCQVKPKNMVRVKPQFQSFEEYLGNDDGTDKFY